MLEPVLNWYYSFVISYSLHFVITHSSPLTLFVMHSYARAGSKVKWATSTAIELNWFESLKYVECADITVFVKDCKQRTAFVALPLHSNYSQHTLHAIVSRQFTPDNCQSGSIRIETTSQNGLIQTGSKSIRLEPVYM